MPVIVIMRHAEAEPMRPEFDTPKDRPLTARGRVQADGTAWRVACSFGHAITDETIPGAETSRSGRTGIRAKTDRILTQPKDLSHSEDSRTIALTTASDPFHTAILSLESLRMAAIDLEDAPSLTHLDDIEASKVSKDSGASKRSEVPKALPVVVWSSPAKRCLESAAPLCELLECKPRTVEALYEDKEFDIMLDVLSALPPDCQRLVLVTHLPQIETTLSRLGITNLGYIPPSFAARLLFDNSGRLVASRRI